MMLSFSAFFVALISSVVAPRNATVPSINIFVILPLVVQHQFVWIYCERSERAKIRELSVACNSYYLQMYANETKKQRAFYDFALFIDDLNFNVFKHKCIDLKLKQFIDVPVSKADVILVEKIIFRIAANKNLYHINNREVTEEEHVNAREFNNILVRNLVVEFLDYLELNVTRCPAMRAMINLIESFSDSNAMQHTALIQKLLEFGLKGKNKYNLYTKFAFLHLELFFEFHRVPCQNEITFGPYPHCLRSIWSNILSVDFIEDYLKFKRMRGDEVGARIGFVAVPIKLMIDDALRENGTLMSEKLHLFAEHPRLFLHFDSIMEAVISSEHSDEENVIKLFDYFVNASLNSWQKIHADYFWFFDKVHMDYISPLGPMIGRIVKRKSDNVRMQNVSSPSPGRFWRNPLIPPSSTITTNSEGNMSDSDSGFPGWADFHFDGDFTDFQYTSVYRPRCCDCM